MALSAITSYGPYYRSSRRAMDTTNRALGKPTMAPETIAAERYGEIEAQRTDAERRRQERLTQSRWSAEYGLQKDTAENLEEAQKVAGMYKAMEFFGETAKDITGQGSATGVKQGNLSSDMAIKGIVPQGASWSDTGRLALSNAPNILGMGATFLSGGNPIVGGIVRTAASIFGPQISKGIDFLGKEAGLWGGDQARSTAVFEDPFAWGPEAMPEEEGRMISEFASDYNQGDATGGGTVICTELHRQGLLDDVTYRADSDFGKKVSPEVLAGYQVWGVRVAGGMKKSQVFTKIVSLFAIPWAKEMAYRMGKLDKGHKFGSILNKIGIPICGFIGKRLLSRKVVLENV